MKIPEAIRRAELPDATRVERTLARRIKQLHNEVAALRSVLSEVAKAAASLQLPPALRDSLSAANQTNRFSCPMCERTFSSLASMRQHMKDGLHEAYATRPAHSAERGRVAE